MLCNSIINVIFPNSLRPFPNFLFHSLFGSLFTPSVRLSVSMKRFALVAFGRWKGWKGCVHKGTGGAEIIVSKHDDLSSRTRRLPCPRAELNSCVTRILGKLVKNISDSWTKNDIEWTIEHPVHSFMRGLNNYGNIQTKIIFFTIFVVNAVSGKNKQYKDSHTCKNLQKLRRQNHPFNLACL